MSALLSTRIVSVGSLAAAASATLSSGVAWATGRRAAPFVFAATASAIIVQRHRANVRRLLRGEEPRLTLRRTCGDVTMR